MEFIIPAYKKDEFSSVLQNICKELRINMGQLQFDFDNSNKAIAYVQDNVIEKMTDEQLNELRSVQ